MGINNENGFTLTEVIYGISIIALLSFWGLVLYIGYHFISKWW
jgi:prepilin-type N-terminal cleavage/methylation domain-containing protein